MSHVLQSRSGHAHDLTSGAIPRHLVRLAIPLLAYAAMQTAYTLVQTMWVGQFLGKTAMAALGNSLSVIYFFMAFAMGLSMGASTLIAQYAGAGKLSQIRKVVQASTVALGVLSLLLTVIGLAITDVLLDGVGIPEQARPLAGSYLRLMLLTLPGQFMLTLFAAHLRGLGDTRTPMFYQGGFLFACAVLDPLLMLGWIGIPALGLYGSALGTLVAVYGAVVLLYVQLRRTHHPAVPAGLSMRIDWGAATLIGRIGLPFAVQQALSAFGLLVVVGVINQFGQDASAAYAVAMRIDQLVSLPALAYSMAIALLAGQNIGVQNYQRVNDVFWWGLALTGGTALLATLVAVVWPAWLLQPFIDRQRDGQVWMIGLGYLRIVGFSYPALAALYVGCAILNCAGYTVASAIISLVNLWLLRIPLSLFLAQRIGRIDGVWYAVLISTCCATVMSLAMYASGFWKKPIVAHDDA